MTPTSPVPQMFYLGCFCMSAFLADSTDSLCGFYPVLSHPCRDSVASLILGDIVEEAGLSIMQVELPGCWSGWLH